MKKSIDYNYPNKPDNINTLENLKTFVEGIPDDLWCVDIYDNGEGKGCILGHIENAYGWAWDRVYPIPSFGRCETCAVLADVNNGDAFIGGSDTYVAKTIEERSNGKSIKDRLIRFFSSLIVNE